MIPGNSQKDAGANLSAIRYHFGEKENLYRAVIQHISDGIRMRVAPFVEEVFTRAERPGISSNVRSSIWQTTNVQDELRVPIVAYNSRHYGFNRKNVLSGGTLPEKQRPHHSLEGD